MSLSRAWNFLYKLVWAVSLDFLILFSATIIYFEYFSPTARNEKVQNMYKQIIAQTGQTQNALPLVVIEDDTENAYNDGTKIVIYTGLIDRTESWDEVALVLGHEVAHGMLEHLGKLNTNSPNEIRVLEANADKMGAVYMMKAGFDVCAGRKIFHRWLSESGNGQNFTHPDYSYRYAELNINCE